MSWMLITSGKREVNICRSRQLSFLASAKKCFIQLHRLKAAFEERKKYGFYLCYNSIIISDYYLGCGKHFKAARCLDMITKIHSIIFSKCK